MHPPARIVCLTEETTETLYLLGEQHRIVSVSGYTVVSWVSELIDIAGGVDIFPELAGRRSAKDRIVAPDEVIRRAPDVIVGSWCGKKCGPCSSQRARSRDQGRTHPSARTGGAHGRSR